MKVHPGSMSWRYLRAKLPQRRFRVSSAYGVVCKAFSMLFQGVESVLDCVLGWVFWASCQILRSSRMRRHAESHA